MGDICEILNQLNELYNEENTPLRINISVCVEPVIDEGLPSGELNAHYDEQTIEDWNNFTDNIEEIIEVENNYELVNVAYSNKGNKLSTYYNFFINTDKQQPRECIINLRVSDHASNTSIRQNRKKHIKTFIKSQNIKRFKLYGITINDKLYDNYDDALDAVRQLIEQAKI